jgi:heat shock protein HslJ
LTQDKIATLQAENQSLRLTASQQAQNAYLVDQLAAKAPVPAYVVANPNSVFTGYGGYGTYYGNCGCNA